jgi:hypothetical protein
MRGSHFRRRLAKDFENLAQTLATFVTLASIQLAVRRLARVIVGIDLDQCRIARK